MITKDNTYAVMKLFFDSPEKKFHMRQIARLTHLSPPGVAKIVAKLKKEGLLSLENTDLVKNAFATRTDKFICLKKCHNLFTVQESKLIELLREEYEEPEAIVLFGSFAKGEDTSKSDIDIAVVTTKSKALDLKKVESKLNKKVNVYEINIKECTKEFLNNLANGIVLAGYLKLIP